ncbi:MAG TPA: hypothetical protein VIP46_02135 [Pyrinomonadaceae bacterium]
MTIIKRKTKKRIGKQLRKLVKRHGSEAALGAATALVTAVITKAAVGDKEKGKGKRSPKGRKRAEISDKKAAKSSKGKQAERTPTA